MKLLRKFSSFFAGFLLFPLLAFGQARYENQFFKPLPAGGVTQYSGTAQVCLGTGLVVTSSSVTSNVATLVMSSNPITAGFINGRDVLLINFPGGSNLNGSYTMTSVTSTQIQFSITHADAGSLGSGGALMKPTASAGCAPSTPVYSDQGLTTQLNTPIFGDDGSGNVRFFAAPGTYWLSYSASGAQPYLSQITIPFINGTGGNLVSPTISNPTISGNLVAPTIGPSAGQQHTLPAVASDTFALLAAAQTLTNKTLTSPALTNPTAQHYLGSGTAPTCSVTGAGTGPTCDTTTVSGSKDSAGVIAIHTGTTPSSSGTVTLIYNGSYPTNGFCTFMLLNSAGSWNARATVIGSTIGGSAQQVNWDNNAVNLTASSQYELVYVCKGS